MLLVAVDECSRHLCNVACCSFLSETALFPHLLENFTTRGEFQDEVDTLVVVKIAEQPQDVAMAQMRLDLDLPTKLILHS